ncbi:hypothetical protein [Nocardiopsis halophila]|uniref:hypothetical protein n=1 Tax=Nocardiopsis halophila TaxID=141692 RepID=UPI00034646CC|nr:hypothetical protein [Nocardiopsis halophila]
MQADHEQAEGALNLLQEREAAGAPVFSPEVLAALRDLVERRGELHTALTAQREALDGLARALAAAWGGPPAHAPSLQAAFEQALNPAGGGQRVR